MFPQIVFPTYIAYSVLYSKKPKISVIERKAFKNMVFISLLDLSNNEIITLPLDTFSNVTNLSILRISHNIFTDLKLNMFNNKPVMFIKTNDFHICCIVRMTIHCSAVKPWYTSCSKL